MISLRHARHLAITLSVVAISGGVLINEPFRIRLAVPFVFVVLICVMYGIRTSLNAGNGQVTTDIDMLASARTDLMQGWVEEAMRAPYGVSLYLRVLAITTVVVIAPYITTLWVDDQQRRIALLLADAAFALWSLHQIYFWLYLARLAQVFRYRKATRQSRF